MGRRRFHRSTAIGLTLSAAAALPAIACAQTEQADSTVIVQIDLRTRNRLAEDFFGFERAGRLYLPVTSLFQLLQFPLDPDTPAHIVSGYYVRENQSFVLDIEAGTAVVAGEVMALEAGDVIVHDGAAHISVDALDRLFKLGAKFDPRNQRVDFAPAYPLAQEELARRIARGAKLASASTDSRLPAATDTPDDYRLFGSPFVHADLSAGLRDGGRFDATASFFGVTELLYATANFAGALSSDGSGDLRATLSREDPDLRIFGPVGASRIAIGDVVAAPVTLLDRSGSEGRGITIARQPLDASGQFDTTQIIGNAPPGYQAELYRDNTLLAFQDIGTDGRFAFEEVELLFGSNRFRVELYGPSGERESITRTIEISQFLVEPGELRYEFSAIDRGSSLFGLSDGIAFSGTGGGTVVAGGRMNSGPELRARASYGLTRDLTLRALVSTMMPQDGSRQSFAGAGVTAFIGPMLVDADAVVDADGGWANRIAVGGGIGAVSIFLERSGFEDFDSPDNQFGGARRLEEELNARLSGQAGALNFSFQGSRQVFSDGRRNDRASARLSTNLLGLSVSQGFSFDLARMPSEPSREPRIRATTGASGRIGPVRLRAGVDWSVGPETRVRSARLEVSSRLAGWYVTTGGSRDLASRRNNLFFRANREWQGVKLGGDLRYSNRGGDLSARVTLSFDLDRDPSSGRFRIGNTANSDFGTIALLPFEDHDGDGLRDAGEPVLSGVEFRLSDPSRPIVTGEETVFERLRHRQPLFVEVDPGLVATPYLAPRDPRLRIKARPGTVRKVEVPFVETGEAILTVRDGDRALSNRIVILRPVDGGPDLRQTSAFDGKVFFSGVLPGAYEVRIGNATFSHLEIRSGDVVREEVAVGPKAENTAVSASPQEASPSSLGEVLSFGERTPLFAGCRGLAL